MGARDNRGAGSRSQDPLSLYRQSASEETLLEAIIEGATLRGWLCHHIRRSDKALQQGRRGYPDLTLARNGVTIWIETKSATGEVTVDQRAWLAALGAERAYVVRPADLDWVLDILLA